MTDEQSEAAYDARIDRVRALRREAGAAYDPDMIALCDAAIRGDSAALELCEDAMRDAAAQLDAHATIPQAQRCYLIDDADGVPLAHAVTWAELAAVNDPDVMDDIADIGPGEETILGQCDRIRRTT